MTAKAADESVYTVKGVTVDVAGDSALDARKKAFAEARRKAYEQLASNLLSAEQRPNLVVPDDKVLAGLVRDLEIVQEKMTTKRYAGTLDIRFNPAAVKRTIAVADRPQTTTDETASVTDTTETPRAPRVAETANKNSDVYSPAARKGVVAASASKVVAPAPRKGSQAKPDTVLVLPWYGPIGRQTLWGPNNPWRAAWESDDATRSNGAVVVLPVGDVDDVRDYSPPQPLSRRGDVDALMKRYGAQQAVLALAEKSAGGGLLVSLYHFENGAPIPMGRFGMDALSTENALPQAVRKSIAAMQGLTASEGVAEATPVSIESQPELAAPSGGQFRTLARFSGLQEWVSMRQALARVPGLGALNVRAISPSQASIEFIYPGDMVVLSGILAQSGLSLEPAPQGISTDDRPAQFTLAFKKGY